MTTELFMMKTGTSMIHIPYKGSGPMIIDLMGGQIQVAFDNLPTALAQVKNGKLKALAITSAERSKFAPNVPTLNEYIPGMTVTAWQGLFAPVKTPAPILDQLSNEIQAVMKMPEVVSKLNDLGVTPVGNTRAEFSAFVKDEINRWAEVVKISGAKPDE
jgi:tripartite-type tricarboxylate transporter receptor subunit TctC